jgi:hypothetical protein
MRKLLAALALTLILFPATLLAAEPSGEGRRPASDEEQRYWLLNTATHGFSPEEKCAALAMSREELAEAYERLKLLADDTVEHDGKSLLVLPYPGGRHPRIGFLDGAINPQRETKVSIFLPWEKAGYVVVDVPEAIWSNLGLTYLAHTHVPTIWSAAGQELEPLEWKRGEDSLSLVRKLPNGIVYEAEVKPEGDAVKMRLSLTNGTKERLSDLRIQNCVMLKAAPGFEKQTNDNKRFESPLVAVQSDDGKRWIITAWERCQRAWGNAPCPCLHSDPQFPDLAPGEKADLTGWLWFYEGDDLDGELKRLKRVMGE